MPILISPIPLLRYYDDLILYLDESNTSKNIWSDKSKYRNNASVFGTARFSGGLVTDGTCIRDPSGITNTPTNYATGILTDVPTGDFSISVTFTCFGPILSSPDQLGQTLFAVPNQSLNGNGFLLAYRTISAVPFTQCMIIAYSDQLGYSTPVNQIKFGERTNFVVTYNKIQKTIKLYVNGKEVSASKIGSAADVTNLDLNYTWGNERYVISAWRSGYTRPLNGVVHNVSFFKRTLTSNEVYELYSNKPVSISTKKTSSDIILYLADKGTSGGWADNSIYSNGARLVGDVKFNSGLIFPGTSTNPISNYAQGTLTVEPGQNFTISAWVQCFGNSSANSTLQTIFSTGLVGSLMGPPVGGVAADPSYGIIFGLREDVRTISFYSDNTGTYRKDSSANIFQFGEIFHAAVKVSTSGGVRTISIYKNGVLSTTSTIPTGSYDWTNKGYRIGNWVQGYEHPFNGKISNVTIYNRTLSDSEVKELYHRMPTSYKSHYSNSNQIPSYSRVLYVDGAEPDSYYAPLGLTSGGLTFRDLSGYKRNGTLTRGYRAQSGVPQGVTGSFPYFETFNSGYFFFNGFLTTNASNSDQTGNSYISFPTNLLPSGSLPSTIIAWARAKPSELSTQYRYIFSYGTYNANGQNRYVGIKYPNQFSVGGAGNANTVLDAPGMIPDKWFQIAFVYTNNEIRMFVNGALKTIKNQTLNTQTPFLSANIGRANTSVSLTDSPIADGYFYGDIAQVLVYNRALNEQEIYKHYVVTAPRFGADFVEQPSDIAQIVAPLVTTIEPDPDLVTSDSFVSGAIVNYDGNAAITIVGVMWRIKTTGPFEWASGVLWQQTSDGQPVQISGLNQNTTYQVRGFASNGSYYGYGEIYEILTILPTPLTVLAVTASFTGIYATATGRVSDLGSGNSNYVERGFVWSTSTINTANADNITTNRVTETNVSIPLWTDTNEQWKLRVPAEGTNLSAGQIYYLRSFAKTQTGTRVYSSNELVFTTYTFAQLTVTIPTDSSLITNTTAQITGNITNGGSGVPVTLRGIVWAESTISQNPVIETHSYTQNGTGTGQFTGTLNGLSAGKTYYVKAYAITSAGVAYSSVANFVTDNVPTLDTVDMTYEKLYPLAYNVGPPPPTQSATASGSITNIGGDAITEIGVLWKITNTTLDINNFDGKTTLTTGITNNFDVKMPNLTANQLYYFRVYARNSIGYGYGQIKQFKTLYQPTVLRVSTPSEFGTTLGQVTLRAYVDNNNFGNSDYYNKPLEVAFAYAATGDPNTTTVVVSTNYTKAIAASTAPNNYFTLTLNLTPGVDYYVTAFARNKGVAGGFTYPGLLVPNVPTVTTTAATNITANSAEISSNVTSAGGDSITVTARGVVYNYSSLVDPEYGIDEGVDLAGAVGAFTTTLSGLPSGQTVFYRAYAVNLYGVGYSSKLSFVTTASATVISLSAKSVTSTTALLRGQVTDYAGNAQAQQLGFYYSNDVTKLPPGTGATRVVASSNTTITDFSLTVTSLTPLVTYFFKSFIKVTTGEAIGNQLSFQTISATSPVINQFRRATFTAFTNIVTSLSNTGVTGEVYFDIIFSNAATGGIITVGVFYSNNNFATVNTTTTNAFSTTTDLTQTVTTLSAYGDFAPPSTPPSAPALETWKYRGFISSSATPNLTNSILSDDILEVVFEDIRLYSPSSLSFRWIADTSTPGFSGYFLFIGIWNYTNNRILEYGYAWDQFGNVHQSGNANYVTVDTGIAPGQFSHQLYVTTAQVPVNSGIYARPWVLTPSGYIFGRNDSPRAVRTS